MIGIIDYGMGNLRSVQKALEKSGGQDVRIISTVRDIEKVDKLVLPGVGAIQPAMDKLHDLGLIEAIQAYSRSGRPFLGICLGYQLMFEKSSEGGDIKGLAILSGCVERFVSTELKIPQMGWNAIEVTQNGQPVYAGVNSGAFVYFCHSYYVKPTDEAIVATWTDYGVRFASSVRKDNVWGMQFHPEKSQDVGLKILENFIRL